MYDQMAIEHCEKTNTHPIPPDLEKVISTSPGVLNFNDNKPSPPDTLNHQTIIQNDCLKVLEDMLDESVDIFVTSPPYNIGVNYKTYKDKKDENKFLEWLYKIFTQIKRVLRKDGSVFLNIGSTSINPWLSYDVANRLRQLFVLQNRFAWVKSISIGEGNHPAIFPEKLVEMCVRLAGYDQNTVVCDPFLGSGTTLIVAKKLGLKGIGIEIDSEYLDYTYRRLRQCQ